MGKARGDGLCTKSLLHTRSQGLTRILSVMRHVEQTLSSGRTGVAEGSFTWGCMQHLLQHCMSGAYTERKLAVATPLAVPPS